MKNLIILTFWGAIYFLIYAARASHAQDELEDGNDDVDYQDGNKNNTLTF